MKHTSNGQASSDIAETGVLHAIEGRGFTGRGVSFTLETSTCLRDGNIEGKIKASRGGYGKSQLNETVEVMDMT